MKLYSTLLSAIFLTLSFCANAGNTGFKVGANISQWSYTLDATKVSIRNGATFSIVGIQEFSISKIISIQLEPSYSQRTFDMDFQKAELQKLIANTFPASLPEPLTITQSFASIDFPILLRVNLKEEGIKPYLFAGPNVSINLSATATTKFDTTNMNFTKPVIEPSAKSALLSLDMGAGVEIPLIASLAIVADARYTLGLSEVSSFKAFDKSIGSAKAADIRVFAGVVFAW